MSHLYSVNRDYYRDVAQFTVARNLARQCQFAIRNDSSTPAIDVRVELFIQSPSVLLYDHDSWPRSPEAHDYALVNPLARLKNDPPLDVEAKKLKNQWVVDLFVEKVQPNSTAWLNDKLYLGSKLTEDIKLTGTIAADNLPAPQPVSLLVKFTSTTKTMSVWDAVQQQLESNR